MNFTTNIGLRLRQRATVKNVFPVDTILSSAKRLHYLVHTILPNLFPPDVGEVLETTAILHHLVHVVLPLNFDYPPLDPPFVEIQYAADHLHTTVHTTLPSNLV